jgi:hypothetical protein
MGGIPKRVSAGLGAAALLAVPALATAQEPKIPLAADPVTVPFPASAQRAEGRLIVSLAGMVPARVTLRASPLRLGDAVGFLRFPDNAGKDWLPLDRCPATGPCVVPFEVDRLWPAGTYKATVSASGPQDQSAAADIAVVRLAPLPDPVITGAAVHEGRLDVSAAGATPSTIALTVQNPAGAPPRSFELSVVPAAAGSGCAGGGIAATPASFRLAPGASQPISLSVGGCASLDSYAAVLLARDADDPASQATTLISVTGYSSMSWRQEELLFWVILGSLLSLLLNNVFPATRAKQALRTTLRQLQAALRDSGNAGAGLLDALAVEATRLKLSVRQISFWDPSKHAALLEAQTASASLATAVTLARRINLLRTSADGAAVSIAVHVLVRARLRDAEEALQAGDAQSAALRLNEAQDALAAARNDLAQKALRDSLIGGISKLMHERGIKRAPAPAAGGAVPALEQPADRHPIIAELVEQLELDVGGYDQLDGDDLLDAERDFYVADVWTEYVEPRLREQGLMATHGAAPPPPDPQVQQAWAEFSAAFLDCLRKSPNADCTQTLLHLIRRNTTPQEIAAALGRGEARIDCDPQPKFLEPVDIALVLTNPALGSVAAARRLASYAWTIGDGSSPPPDVDRCHHYFRPSLPGWVDRILRKPPLAYPVVVEVRVPFSGAKPVKFGVTVRPRPMPRVWTTMPMDLLSFTVTAAIAVVTAFGAKYATGVPNVIDWPDCLTAFMLGFGLDQLRDTVSTPPTPGSAPPPASAIAPPPSAALAPQPAAAPAAAS